MTENIHGIDPWNWSIYVRSILYCLFKFDQNDTNKFLRYAFSSVTACFRNGVYERIEREENDHHMAWVRLYRYRYRCISLCFSLLRFSRRLQCIMCSTFVLLESKRRVTRIFLMTRTETKSLSETFPCSSVESSSHRTLQMSLSFIVFRYKLLQSMHAVSLQWLSFTSSPDEPLVVSFAKKKNKTLILCYNCGGSEFAKNINIRVRAVLSLHGKCSVLSCVHV